jgi:teichuronic acid biosynthesis glycosyltransferase TuaC
VRQTMLRADAVITVSEELRQVALTEGIAPQKVTTVLNGCDHSMFYPGDRGEARRELGVAQDAKVILFVGSLLETKGLGELTEAFAGLAKGMKLVVVGQGPFEAQLHGRESVLLAGRQDTNGVARWMRACDIFCLPSHSEGCPNVVVEALSCGRPVVATNVGGIPELVNESCGILIPPRDPEKLRAALENALSRSWPTTPMFTRTWEDVANETFAICERLYAAP